jgi:hypothetical protein
MAKSGRRRSAGSNAQRAIGTAKKINHSAIQNVQRAREVTKAAFQVLRDEIEVTRKHLELLSAEERSFKSDLFGPGQQERSKRRG